MFVAKKRIFEMLLCKYCLCCEFVLPVIISGYGLKNSH